MREIPGDSELPLSTARLTLEPVTAAHAAELIALFGDPELHRHVEFEIGTREAQEARTRRWAERRSPDGRELWLCWVARERAVQEARERAVQEARERASGAALGAFQAALREDGTASVGYLVARASQGRGFALEAMRAIFSRLHALGVARVEATMTADNAASIRLAEALGMSRALEIRRASFFKGTWHDECVYASALEKWNCILPSP